MSKSQLNEHQDFLVREEKVIGYIIAFLFLGLFLYGLIDMFLHKFKNVSYVNYLFILALAPAIIGFSKAKSKRVYIRINSKGIYQDEKLITTWSHFLNAFIEEKQVALSIKDNFMLVVEYVKDKSGSGYRKKIPLTNTQNKSEEQIIAAIKFFYRAYQASNI